MKKITALVSAFLLIFSLCGCKNKLEIFSSYYSEFIEENLQNNEEATSSVKSGTASKKPIVIGQKTEEIITEIITTTTVISSKGGETSSCASSEIQPVIPTGSEDDVTQKQNDRVNDYIQSQLPDGEEITQEKIDQIINNLIVKDGMTFYYPENFEDTVSMTNLYYEPMKGKFSEIDAQVMASLKEGKAKTIETPWYEGEGGADLVQEYIGILYWKNTLLLENYLVRGSQILIDTQSLIEQKKELENKSYYKNIQNAIKECGIEKGMLQRDAIVRFNEYICQRVKYDNETYKWSLTAFFDEGKAICNSYAQVFELLCRTVGIDCEFMGGSVNVEGKAEKHAWNKVTFSGGIVAYFDVCWNDGEIIIGSQVYQKTDRYLFIRSFNDRSVTDTYINQVVGYGDRFI